MANRDKLKLLKLRPLLLPVVLLAGIETAIIQVPYVLSSPNLVCGLRRPIGTDYTVLKEQFTLLLLSLKEQFTHLLQCL